MYRVLKLNGLFGKEREPTILKILVRYGTIRAHTPAIRTGKAILDLDMIGHYPMLRWLAQPQIAAENGHFNPARSFSWIFKFHDCRLSRIPK